LGGVENIHHSTAAVEDDAMGSSLLALDLHHHHTNSLIPDTTDKMTGFDVVTRDCAPPKGLGGDQVRLNGVLG
jgi:hypothetical protein